MQHRWDGGNMDNSNWNVLPNVSVNGIAFGTDRSSVRKLLGKPKRVIKKTPDAANTTDVYEDFHVYYSAEDKFEAIELFGGSIIVNINSQPLFPGTLSAAYKMLPDLVEYFGIYMSKSASVGICSEGDTIDSILIGRKNYYE